MRRVAMKWVVAAAMLAVPGVRGVAMGQATAPATQSGAEPTVVVKKGTLSPEMQAEAVFLPAEPFELRLKTKVFQGPFTIVKAAGPGEQVKQGDVLIECDPKDINWQIETAEAGLSTARAALKKTEADQELGVKSDALAMRMAEDGVKNAEAAVQWFESVDGPQMLLSGQLSLQQAKYGVEDQDDELEQLRKMYKGEELTTATADIVVKRAVRRLEVSKTMLKMQEERNRKQREHDYQIARQKPIDALEQARQALASLKVTQEQSSVTRKNGLVSARIAVEQAEQKVNELKSDAALMSVKSPSDGIVLYADAAPADGKTLKAGDRLTANSLVLRVMRPGNLKLEVPVADAQAFWIDPTARAQITPVAFPWITTEVAAGNVQATVKGSTPAATFMLPLTFPSPDPRIMPGMKAKVKITGKKVEDVLVVPSSAVSGGKVMVKKNGKTEERPVKVGRFDSDHLEIVSGLEAGEEIFTKPSSK